MTNTATFIAPIDIPAPPLPDMDALILPHQHRRPPRPWWMRAGTPLGVCVWCETTILPGQRPRPRQCHWHLECLHEYRLLFDWPYARHFVHGRDQGQCQSCGLDVGAVFEVDHVQALFLWPARRLGDLRQESLLDWYAPWWPENLQILCQDCHQGKSIAERMALRVVL